MGLYYDEYGQAVELDDNAAAVRGYAPVSAERVGGIGEGVAAQQAQDDSGFLGAARAGIASAASSASLGGSDWLLDQFLDPSEKQQLITDIEAHPYAAGAGTLIGAVGPGLAAPGTLLARTPAGYLSSLTSRLAETGLARGGIAGTAKAAGAYGLEGAIQNVGQYLGRTTLEDKEATAEGVIGSAGVGLAFGAGGGVAALGVVKGTVAARRLFSRTLGPQAMKDAESAWGKASEELLQAETSSLNAAKQELDDLTRAEVEAIKYRQAERGVAAEAKLRSRGVSEQAGPEGVTDVSQTSSARPEDVGPVPLDEGIEPIGRNGQMPTQVYKRPVSGEIDPADAAAFDASLKQPETPAGKADLGGEQVVPGAAVSPQIPPSKKPPPYEGRNPSRSIEGWLAEKDAAIPRDPKSLAAKLNQPVPKGKYSAAELDRMASDGAVRGPVQDFAYHQVGPTKRAPFSNLRTTLGDLAEANRVYGPTLREESIARTEELLGKEAAKRKAQLLDAVDAIESSRAEMNKIDLPEGGGTYGGKPTHRAQAFERRDQIMARLESAHEHALDNRAAAEAVGDTTAVSQWEQNAIDVEHLMDSLPAEHDISWDLSKNIVTIQKHEEVLAKAVDELGDAAHPLLQDLAKAHGKANDDAVRQMSERSVRAAEDVEQLGDVQGPEYRSPPQRVLDAQKHLDDVSGRRMDAQLNYKAAKEKVADTTRAKKAALKEDKAAERAAARASKPGKYGVYGGVLEMLDIPGLPKPSDLPVVGPILGAYLKFRALKAALGRVGGRIPFTGDTRVAMMAAKTRDRVAKAVDASLGVVEKGRKYIAPSGAVAARILATRIYNDGSPEPQTKDVQKLAAARMREVAAYAAHPNAIELDVRKMLRDVSDPDVIAATEKQRRAMFVYLASKLPPQPRPDLLNPVDWTPSGAQALSFARRLEAASNPAGVFEQAASKQGAISLEAAETIQALYPKLFGLAQERLQEGMMRLKIPVPYRQRLQMSLLYKLPLDSALEPDNLKITQSVYERKPASPAYNPAAAPAAQPPTATPSIAQPVDVSQAYMPTLDKR